MALGGLAAGEPRDVWVSELAPDGTPLLEMVADPSGLEEGDPPEMRRIPDVDAKSNAADLPSSPLGRNTSAGLLRWASVTPPPSAPW